MCNPVVLDISVGDQTYTWACHRSVKFFYKNLDSLGYTHSNLTPKIPLDGL